MHIILAIRTNDRLDEVAHQADRIREVICRAIKTITPPAITDITKTTVSKPLETQIQELTKQVASLSAKLSKLKKKTRAKSEQSRNKTVEPS